MSFDLQGCAGLPNRTISAYHRETMRGSETTLGGQDRHFPETTIGFLSLLRRRTDEGRRAALEMLCARYWKPVYAYIRAGWSKSNDDAKDLTQSFFLWIQENG